jgi:hypothetical protein
VLGLVADAEADILVIVVVCIDLGLVMYESMRIGALFIKCIDANSWTDREHRLTFRDSQYLIPLVLHLIPPPYTSECCRHTLGQE